MTTMLRILTIVCVALGLAGMRVIPAHAQTTWTVTDCVNQYGAGTAGSPSPGSIQWAVNGANTDNAGDTIRFSCSGTIGLSSTLYITGSMSIDGSGQSVTIDGNNSGRLFSVNSGVIFGLTWLTLTGGSGADGAAIYNDGTLTVENSTLTGNNVSFCGVECFPDGGAIYNTGSGTLTVSGSTFSSNSASDGGAIYNDFGTVTVRASTFSANSVTSGGGAIENAGSNTLIVLDSTFSGNSATYGGAIFNVGTVTIGGDIIANSTSGGNCYGTITDEGYNLDDDGTCTSGKTRDVIGENPDLGPLAYNGGPTQTMALLSGSPAIDRIPSGTSFVANSTTYVLCSSKGTDQRGFPRPDQNESFCDIGAYEYQDPYPLPPGTTAYDIESSNWSCTSGGTSCIPPIDTVASDCLTTTPCSNATYGDVEAFGPPNDATYGIPDELILACVHGTNTGYQIGYLDVVSHQGTLDYPAGTRSVPGVYGTADSGTISGKGTLIGGGGGEDNSSQPSSVSGSAYDLTTGIIGSVTGIQNTDNTADSLNAGQFRVTIRGRLWTVNTTGTTPVTTRNTASSMISCTVGGLHGTDLMNAGIDTDALAEGELEASLGDNGFLPTFAPTTTTG